MKVDLIVFNSGQLVTCASNGIPKKSAAMRELSIIKNGAISVSGGEILAVGKSAEILNDYQSENVIDADGRVICPGFVECHTHLVFAGNRLDEFELKIKGAEYLEILKSGGGILSTVKATREASLENLIVESKKRLNKLLESGITTCEIKTGYGLSPESELKMLEAILRLDLQHAIDIIPTFLAAHAVPLEFKENPDGYVNLICNKMLLQAASLLRLYKSSDLEFEKENKNIFSGLKNSDETDPSVKKTSGFVDVFCEKNAFNLEQSRKILEKAKAFGFSLKAHVDEFTNLGGARMAIELGATSIDHLDAISEEEIKLLAESETIGVITPTVNFNFGSKEFADARKMVDAGCAIAVSTDFNPGSAPCPSLPNAMAIACRYQKILPSEILNAATINAAFAVGAGNRVGSLEEGKNADFLILDANDYRQIMYEFGSNPVCNVFKNGKLVFSK